jgi:hypothetical protein
MALMLLALAPGLSIFAGCGREIVYATSGAFSQAKLDELEESIEE